MLFDLTHAFKIKNIFEIVDENAKLFNSFRASFAEMSSNQINAGVIFMLFHFNIATNNTTIKITNKIDKI